MKLVTSRWRVGEDIAASPWIAGACALLTASGTILADTTDQVQLQLRLVAQMGTPSNPASTVTSMDADIHTDTASGPGVPRRFEVQYRIIDLNSADGLVPAGLAAAYLRIEADGGTLERAILSRFEGRNPSSGTPSLPPVSRSVNLDTDTSVISGTSGNPFMGLHAPFRNGIVPPQPNNGDPANGVFSPDNRAISDILPLALGVSDQNDGGWYGLYSFNFIPTAALGRVRVWCVPEPSTGSSFGFFWTGATVPTTCGNATADTATVVVTTCIAGVPSISQHPLSISVFNDATALFSVTASGGPDAEPLTYQWRRDGVNLTDGPTGTGSVLAGAITPTLTLSQASVRDRGFAFDCVVTNLCGRTRSDPAGLNVTWRCQADFNRSGTLGPQDIFDFLAAYFAGCP